MKVSKATLAAVKLWNDNMDKVAMTFIECAEACQRSGDAEGEKIWKRAAAHVRVQSRILMNKTSGEDTRG